MKLDNVHVIGGGPAGLFAAILLRKLRPVARVTVHERSVPDDTFGFGVAFTRRTLEMLTEADRTVVEALEAASVKMPPQEMRVGEEAVFSGGNTGGMTISRSALLRCLLEQAERSGVEVRLGTEATLGQVRSADLVIAADGVGSAVRTELDDDFQSQVTQGRGLFMWLGCDARLDSNLFAPVRSAHGLFNIHCYPYSEDRSTIGVETDVATWQRAGMDRWTDETDYGQSDQRSIAYLQDLFGPVLGDATLLGNKSRWMNFRTVSAARWSHDNVVLIGDAAHTAHYSVGSGTKMAMEDAVSLVHALDLHGEGELDAALSAYEAERRPRVEHLQGLAERSRLWWESLEVRLDLPPSALMLAYLSRGGAVGVTRAASTESDLVNVALAQLGFGGDAHRPDALLEEIAATPWPLDNPRLDSRRLDGTGDLHIWEAAIDVADPWGPTSHALVDHLVSTAPVDCDVILLVGASTRPHVLDHLAFAEHLASKAPCAVAVDAPEEYLEDLVDGLIARRIDLFRLTSRSVSADLA